MSPMADDTSPTLADDEAKLAEYSTNLIEAFDAVALPWLQRLVDLRAPGMGALPPVVAVLTDGAESTVAELRALLELDIDDQQAGPLSVLRSAVRYPTKVLADAGVATVDRDDFAVQSFPNDVYDLSPASFGAVDAQLHEPGLVWGAAKAHVHLRRRREPRVVALSVDLIDRSKISGAFPDAKLVRSVAKLVEMASQADVAFVDLGRVDEASVLRQIPIRVIAFGSHVNEAVLEAAHAAGAEALPRSVFFRRLETGDL